MIMNRTVEELQAFLLLVRPRLEKPGLYLDFDINRLYQDLGGCPILHAATVIGGDILRHVLAFPDLEVNGVFGDGMFGDGGSAVHVAIAWNERSLRVLLADPRVDLTVANAAGHTPLEFAALFGKLRAVVLLLASDKPQIVRVISRGERRAVDRAGLYAGAAVDDLGRPLPQCSRDELVNWKIRRLLQWYLIQPQDISRHCLKVKTKDPGHVGAPLFALVLLATDGYLAVPVVPPPATLWTFLSKIQVHREEGVAGAYLRRFLGIAARLPIELQMVLCNVAAGSTRANITSAAAEQALRDIIFQDVCHSSFSLRMSISWRIITRK